MNQLTNNNPYSVPTALQEPVSVDRRMHSRLGIFSLLTALFGIALALVMFVILVSALSLVTPGQSGGNDGLVFVLGICALATAANALTAIGLGIGCIRQTERKKLFGYVGLTLGSLQTLGLAGLMLLGAVA